MNVKQVSIFLEHKPGTLYEVIKTLMDKDIHIRAFSVVETGGVSVVRLIVDNILWTASILKTLGYPATFTEVAVVSIQNSALDFCHVLEVMKNAGVNIEYSYSVSMQGPTAGFVFEVSDTEGAYKALSEAGLKVITHEELYSL